MSMFSNNNDSNEVMSGDTPASLKSTVRNAANLFGNYFASKKPVQIVTSVTSAIANTSATDIKDGIKVIGLNGVNRVGKILNGIYHGSVADVVGVVANPIAKKISTIKETKSLVKRMKDLAKEQLSQ